MFFKSLFCPYSYSFPMTARTFIEVFSHFFSDFLWFELDSFDHFPTVTTIESDITTFRIEVILSFFSERRDIYEICIGSRQMDEKWRMDMER